MPPRKRASRTATAPQPSVFPDAGDVPNDSQPNEFAPPPPAPQVPPTTRRSAPKRKAVEMNPDDADTPLPDFSQSSNIIDASPCPGPSSRPRATSVECTPNDADRAIARVGLSPFVPGRSETSNRNRQAGNEVVVCKQMLHLLSRVNTLEASVRDVTKGNKDSKSSADWAQNQAVANQREIAEGLGEVRTSVASALQRLDNHDRTVAELEAKVSSTTMGPYPPGVPPTPPTTSFSGPARSVRADHRHNPYDRPTVLPHNSPSQAPAPTLPPHRTVPVSPPAVILQYGPHPNFLIHDQQDLLERLGQITAYLGLSPEVAASAFEMHVRSPNQYTISFDNRDHAYAFQTAVTNNPPALGCLCRRTVDTTASAVSRM